MTTVVDFRARRSEADAARARAEARCLCDACPAEASLPAAPPPAPPPAAGDASAAGAEIILLPLAWISRIRHAEPRKPLRRRYSLRRPILAPA